LVNSVKGYEYLEHTADVMFRAYGDSPGEMLGSAALAMFNAMIDTGTVRPQSTWKVELRAESLEQLAYDWLSELLFLMDSEVVVFSEFQVDLKQDGEIWRLEGLARGEGIDRSRHPFENQVKAVTLHQFRVEGGADGWMMQAILDV